MDIRVDRDVLDKAIAPCVEISDAAGQLPICAHLALDASGDMLTARASRIEQHAVSRSPVATKSPGSACVAARQLRDAIRKMPAGELRLVATERQLELTSGKARLRLPSQSASDFPLTPTPAADAWIDVPGAALRAALEAGYAAETDIKTRPHLCALRIESDGNSVRGISAAGARLAMTVHACETAPFAVTLPIRMLRTVANLVGKRETVRLAHDAATVSIEVDGIVITSRQVDGFPGWQGLVAMAESAQTSVRAVRIGLAEVIDRVGLVVSDQSAAEKSGSSQAYCARIEVRDGVLRASADSPSFGSSNDELAVDVEGPAPKPFGISPRYLSEALAQHADDIVTISIGKHTAPLLVRGSAGISLVMPMHLAGQS